MVVPGAYPRRSPFVAGTWWTGRERGKKVGVGGCRFRSLKIERFGAYVSDDLFSSHATVPTTHGLVLKSSIHLLSYSRVLRDR